MIKQVGASGRTAAANLLLFATSAAAFVHRYKLTVGCQHPICKQTWLMQEELTPECLALFLLSSFKFFLSYSHFSFSFPLSRSMLHLGSEMDDTDVTFTSIESLSKVYTIRRTVTYQHIWFNNDTDVTFRPTSIESLSKVCTTKKDGYLPIYVVSTLLNLLLMDCRCTARLIMGASMLKSSI